jgi:hypothetical protein
MTSYVADDNVYIAKRLEEMRQERERDEDHNRATGPALDMHGHRVGLDRAKDESDYTFRMRILEKMRAP